MNEKYLLEQLLIAGDLMRKAQTDYWAYKADPRTDPIKKAYLQESKRREQDYDKMRGEIRRAIPELKKA